jgi:hypothetical protein
MGQRLAALDRSVMGLELLPQDHRPLEAALVVACHRLLP